VKFLLPRKLRRAIAKASLRKSWRLAGASGLNGMDEDEINQEIARVRSGLRRK
jgi:hypothetical protein